MIHVDLRAGEVVVDGDDGDGRFTLNSPEAFAIISRAWLRVGWDTKYVYGFTWLGRPVIQLPEDMLRIQEVIYECQPDVIIETGVAHGGSLIYYASLCTAMDKGRVVGIDIEIRPHNRAAIEAHAMSRLITLVEGSSTDDAVVSQVRALVAAGESTLVLLDSNHSRDHVLNELRAYAPLVSPGSYIVATDGIMQDLPGAPRSAPDWDWNNPQEAARLFLRETTEFELVEPEFPFNEGVITERVTYWPNCYLRRKA
jgi:cephalosporin hydroxylase